MAGSPDLKAERCDLIDDLDRSLREHRSVMESAGLEFMLPMMTLKRAWSETNLARYASDPGRQARYMMTLENLEDAILGVSIIDPSLSSLYWLTGWITPGKEMSDLERYLNTYASEAPVLSRMDIRDCWASSSLPLIQSTTGLSSHSEIEADLSIEVSSHLSGQAGYTYTAVNLMDSDPTSAWMRDMDTERR